MNIRMGCKNSYEFLQPICIHKYVWIFCFFVNSNVKYHIFHNSLLTVGQIYDILFKLAGANCVLASVDHTATVSYF